MRALSEFLDWADASDADSVGPKASHYRQMRSAWMSIHSRMPNMRHSMSGHGRVLSARLSAACILALLAVLTLSPTDQAEAHTVYIPLTRNTLLDDSLTWATVVRVSDGNTIAVGIDDCPIEGMKVRPIGTDTPERGE